MRQGLGGRDDHGAASSLDKASLDVAGSARLSTKMGARESLAQQLGTTAQHDGTLPELRSEDVESQAGELRVDVTWEPNRARGFRRRVRVRVPWLWRDVLESLPPVAADTISVRVCLRGLSFLPLQYTYTSTCLSYMIIWRQTTRFHREEQRPQPRSDLHHLSKCPQLALTICHSGTGTIPTSQAVCARSSLISQSSASISFCPWLLSHCCFLDFSKLTTILTRH